MESFLRSVEAREPSLDSVRSGWLPLLGSRGQGLQSGCLPAHLPMGMPEPHLGSLGGSSERPRMSWLSVRGLGTGLGALDFLHQMAKPPMSLE